MQLEKRQIQSLMFDQRKERTVFEEQQEEMDELGRSILKDKSNVLQSTLAAAKLSAEISRQEAKLEELAEKIKAQQQSLAANKSEHAQVLVQIELEESRVAEQNDASDAIRLLLAVAWTLSLRSSHLAALTPTQVRQGVMICLRICSSIPHSGGVVCIDVFRSIKYIRCHGYIDS
jgi:ectoine hydroxylase-related dioxygenase (phytanoyl-CoA dioxygenase family)